MTPEELKAAGLTQDTKTLEQIVAPEKKADVFDPNTGKWGTYSTVGTGENMESRFTPDTVQPTTGYASSVAGGSAQDPTSSFQWNEGIDPAVTARNAAAADAAKVWGIDAALFHKQVDPLMGQYNTWNDPSGDLSTGAQLTLANGQVWRPSGASSGITYSPDTGYYTVSGDLSALLGQPGSDQHATVSYKEVDGKMVPVEAPSTYEWQGPYHGLGDLAKFGVAAVSAYFAPQLAAELMGGAGVGGATLTAENAAALNAAYGSGALAAGEAVGGAGIGQAGILSTISNLPTTIGSAITPAGTPGWLANAAGSGAMSTGTSLAQGNDLGTALKSGVKGAVTGAAYSGLNTLGNEVLSPMLQGTGVSVKDAISLGTAALTGNTAGLVTAGLNMGIDGLAKLSGLDSSKLPSWLTKENITGATNLTTGLRSGNLAQILSGASALTGSADVKTASAATNLFNAAKSGNWSAISASAGALDKVLGGTGTPDVKTRSVGAADPTKDYSWYTNDSTIGDKGGRDDVAQQLVDEGAITADMTPEEIQQAIDDRTNEWLIENGGGTPLNQVTITGKREQPYVPWEEGFVGSDVLTNSNTVTTKTTTPAPKTSTPADKTPATPQSATPAAKTPATPQSATQAAQDGYMPPIVLVKINKLFENFGPAAFTGMSIEDLVKSVESGDAPDTEAENPIYAAQGGSIDDLIEYLRR